MPLELWRSSCRVLSLVERLHNRKLLASVALMLAALPSGSCIHARSSAGPDVTRATLDNGLRVVIVRDPLAPVVTVEENYLVGGNDTPSGFPGICSAMRS